MTREGYPSKEAGRVAAVATAGNRAARWCLLALLLACGAPTPSAAPGGRPGAPAQPTAVSSPALAAGVAQPEWDRLVAAARTEGKLSLAVPPGPQYEPAIREAFAQTFPGIQVEMVNLLGGQFRQRVEKERAAGQYDWDACICGPGADTYRMAKDGVFDPVLDDAVLPEVLDDSKWLGGIKSRFADEDKKYAFAFAASNNEGGFQRSS